MEDENKSEFGKGCAYCLVLFANHFDNDMWHKVVEYNWAIQGKEVSKDAQWWLDNIVPIYKGDKAKALSSQIVSWANGASDHLYDLQIPQDGSELSDVLTEIRETGLKMGHGFLEPVTWTPDDMFKLRELTFKAATLIDQKLGVEVEKGQWE
ncbi:MAG: hypothetical protein WC444_06225 [Candidatus Paceibacterota bacterium]